MDTKKRTGVMTPRVVQRSSGTTFNQVMRAAAPVRMKTARDRATWKELEDAFPRKELNSLEKREDDRYAFYLF